MNVIANAHLMFDLPQIDWAPGSLRYESDPLPAAIVREPEAIEHKKASKPRPSEKRKTIHQTKKCKNPNGHKGHKRGRHPGGTQRMRCYWCSASWCEAK